MGKMLQTTKISTEKKISVKRGLEMPPVFAGFAAGLFTVNVLTAAIAVTPVDLKDDRKAKSMGYDLIYEARDLDLPQNVRDGLTQARSSVSDTKKRVAESKTRITKEVLPYIEKAYWTEAKEALRLQVG